MAHTTVTRIATPDDGGGKRRQPAPRKRPASDVRFRPYEVVKPLGVGGAGEVFLVRERATGKRFVLKRLRVEVLGDLDLVRFRREAGVMRTIDHPNIMPVVHVETASNPPWYLMPYREGRTLADWLSSGPLDLELALRVARDASAALAELHRRGIVHRDVKPKNLLLDANWQTILLDFGLARIEREGAVTAAGTILGTPGYMAPEQCRGEPATDRADVYSLGVTVIEMLLGKNPFAAEDIAGTLRRHLHETPRRLDALLPGRVDAELGELVHRMIAKTPGHRPRAQVCLEAFEGLARNLVRRRRG